MRNSAAAIALLLTLASATAATTAFAAERTTLADAVTRAYREAASSRVADLKRREAEHDVTKARSKLLPEVQGNAAASDRTYNIATFGLPIPGESLIGPVHEVDASVSGSMPLFDLSAWKGVSAASAAAGASGADASNEAAEAAYAAGIAYLKTARAEALMAARHADVDLADELLSLSRSRFESGAAANIDVTRAQTQMAEAREMELIARNDADAARIQLVRALGLPATAEIELADTLSDAVASAVPESESADSAVVAFALERRSDLKAAQARLLEARRTKEATGAERLPSLGLRGDYGWSGTNPNDAIAVRDVAIEMKLPIWDGLGRESRLARQSLVIDESSVRVRDLEQKVATEVKTAKLALANGLERERIASERLALANAEVDQARERFANGVAGNIEVIDAQSSLNRARESAIDARAAVALAKIELARAAGVAETVRQP